MMSSLRLSTCTTSAPLEPGPPGPQITVATPSSPPARALPPALVRRQVVVRILVDRQPVAGAGEHRHQELLGVRRLDGVAVGAVGGGGFHLALVADAGHHD